MAIIVTIIALAIGIYFMNYVCYFVCIVWTFCRESARIREKRKRVREALECAETIRKAEMRLPNGIWRCEYCLTHNSRASTVCKACLQSKKDNICKYE